MDKLQPIIKHKYWVVSGLALLLMLVGWYLSSSAQATAIEERTQKLDALNVPGGTGTPNQKWIDELSEVNKDESAELTELQQRLYNDQKKLWTWPKDIEKDFSGEYRQAVDFDTRDTYRRRYDGEFSRVYKTVDPEVSSKTRKPDGTIEVVWRGKVVVDRNMIQQVDNRNLWGNRPPTVMEMWDAQEDIWLTESIMRALAAVNSGAEKISEAPLRRILVVSLHGGTPPTEGGEEDGAAPDDDYEGEPDMAASPFGEFGTGGGLETGGTTTIAQASFAPADVFGSDAALADTTDTDTGDGEDMYASPLELGAPGGAGAAKKRYYDDDPEMPFKTRGFYLEVFILNDKLPDLQAQLVGMEWPTELLRVQWVALNDGDFGNSLAQMQPKKVGGATVVNPLGNPAGRGGINGAEMPGGRSPFGGRPAFGTPPGIETENGAFGNGMFGQGMQGGISNTAQSEQATAALNDPYLAHVAIAGLMTIYRSPTEDPEQIAAAAAAEDEASKQENPEILNPETPDPNNPDANTPDPNTPDPNNPDAVDTADPGTDPATPVDGTPMPADPTNGTVPSDDPTATPAVPSS